MHSGRKVDWPAVIRIGQTEVPQLAPAIEIRQARRGSLQYNLGQRRERSIICDSLLNSLEIRQKSLAYIQRFQERVNPPLVVFVDFDPACMGLALTESLRKKFLQSIQFDRPCAKH